MQIVSDALDEAVGEGLELGHDEVALRLHVLLELRRALASKLFQPFRRSKPGGNIVKGNRVTI